MQFNYPIIPNPAEEPFPPGDVDPVFDPSTVKTFVDLKAIIDQFTDENKNSAFSFAHIALGDFNLSDGHIQLCLEPLSVMTWFNWKLSELARHPEFSQIKLSGESWERYDYDQLFEMCYRTIVFLKTLLLVPEAIREDYP